MCMRCAGENSLMPDAGRVQGFLYVLDSHGDTRDGWPKQMAQIEAQVAVGDVDGDGRLELVAADSHGNLAVFTPEAEEVWEVHLGSPILQVWLILHHSHRLLSFAALAARQ